ncbi:unnamed protein product [Caenorhabditis auriculariae]|uniref:Reverse transcriptase domain-containing protein n=1 Tax=Caenorhabditis auriculariae TaxID=2777116 RepID=A0A8S1HL26_9PELO|nr:unnamed protein product [Caenorhabditis auriculariae]
MNTITSPGIMTIRITNVSDNTYEIQKGTILGQACVLRIPEQPRTFPPIPVEQYTPPEADWDSKLPSLPKDLLKELNLQRCALDEGQQRELRKIIIAARSSTTMELLAQGIIEPSLSTFPSPVVLVKKKDSRWRFTVDYRQLNAVTKKQVYLIPTVSEIVDLAAGAKFFTNLDLISGFFQLPLREEDRPLTAFTTPSGTYQFRRMGLCGAPHTFQYGSISQKKHRTRWKDVIWKSPIPVHINEDDHATMLRIQLAELWKFTRERLRVGQARQKKNYEKTHQIAERKICTGDLVLVKRAPAKNKLAPYLHGPNTVISVSGPNIQYAQDNRIAKAHKNDQTEELQDYPEDDTIAEAPEQSREAQQPAPQRPQRLRKPPKRLQH